MANTSETQTDNRPQRLGTLHAALTNVEATAEASADILSTPDLLRAALREVAGIAARALAESERLRNEMYALPADALTTASLPELNAAINADGDDDDSQIAEW